jgi:hypothetical protein
MELVLIQTQVHAEVEAVEPAVLAWSEIWGDMAAPDCPRPLQVTPFGMPVGAAVEP